MPLFKTLPLMAVFLVNLLLIGCNAPEDYKVTTSLTFISPWDVQVDGKPVITSVDTKVSLSYTIADAAFAERDDLEYSGSVRFLLYVNGIDVTERQFVRDFKISKLGQGGVIKFDNLQAIESALIPGENVFSIKTVGSKVEEASARFNFTAQPAQLVVSNVESLESNATGVDRYRVSLEVVGQTGLAQEYNDTLNRVDYGIKLFDMNGEIHQNDVSFDNGGRLITLEIEHKAKEVTDSPVFRYELTDELGNNQKKGFVLNNQKLNDFVALQLNASFFDAFEPVVNPMVQRIADIFVGLMSTTSSASERGFERWPGEAVRYPQDRTFSSGEVVSILPTSPLLASLNKYTKLVCEQYLTKGEAASVKDRRCVFYANVNRLKEKPIVNAGFHGEGDGKPKKPQFIFDVIVPELSIDLQLIAYDPINETSGKYIGGFKTTLTFEKLVIRDVLNLNVSNDGFLGGLERDDENNLIAREGVRFRYGDPYVQAVSSLIGDVNYSSKLKDTSCPGRICNLTLELVDEAIYIENLTTIPLFSKDLILILEDITDNLVPSIVGSLFKQFPDIGGVKAPLESNLADNQVKSEGDNYVLRNLTTASIEVADINPWTDVLDKFLPKDIGRNWAGRMKFSGAYQSATRDSADEIVPIAVSGRDKLVPYTSSKGLNAQGSYIDGRDRKVDAIASISLNAINQYLASDFQVTRLQDWLSEDNFTVDEDSGNLKGETLSKMLNEFKPEVHEGQSVSLQFTINQAPEMSFIGEKEWKYQYSYNFFGLITGGKTDDMVTPAVKLSFYDVNVLLVNNTTSNKIFDVNADFSIEANISFDENGLPKFYIRTPQAPQALYEDEPERRLDKQLAIDINQVNFFSQLVANELGYSDRVDEGKPKDAQDLLLKVKLSSAFAGIYRQQVYSKIQRKDEFDQGTETFFDDLMKDFLVEHFTQTINFSDDKYTCDDCRVELADSITRRRTLEELYRAEATLVKGELRWFTINTSGGWLNMGLNFTPEVQSDEKCPELEPFSICFTKE